jgi:hypothetical protein
MAHVDTPGREIHARVKRADDQRGSLATLLVIDP